MLEFARMLTIPSLFPYAVWRLTHSFPCVDVKLRNGPRIELRMPEVGNNDDVFIAWEVFYHDWYNLRGHLRADAVEFVVDMGANCGFSVLHWLDLFPRCRVLAFEPNPTLAPQVRRNVALNHAEGRVEVLQAAAGASARRMRLTDKGTMGRLTEENGPASHSVEVLDVFPLLEGKKIDLLKMDIEEGEYELLADPRFDGLDIKAIVMEWHGRADPKADKQFCYDRLTGLGFQIDEIFVRETFGMFWAVRQGTPA